MRYLLAAILVMLAFVPAQLAAQEAVDARPGPTWHASALFGAISGGGGLAAVQAGASWKRHMVYGEFALGATHLEAVCALIADASCANRDGVIGSAAGGVRFWTPRAGPLRPYVSGGAGLLFGSLSGPATGGPGEFSRSWESATMLHAGGGVLYDVGRRASLQADVTHRWVSLFRFQNVTQALIGVNVDL